MAMEPDILDLSIPEGSLQVRPIVNGRDLLADILPGGVGGSRYLGTNPRYLLGRDRPLHATTTPQEVRLAKSGCGVEFCCGALYVTVRRDGDHVVWADLRDADNQDFDLPEFRFTARQYEAALLRAEQDHSWEWPAVVVAMLLEAGLREHEDWLARWDCELEGVWASPKEPDLIHVILRHPPNRADTDLPWVQFEMTLPISADAPSDQAEHLEARLTSGDPRATAEVCGGYNPEQLGYPWP